MTPYINTWRALAAATCCGLLSCSEQPDDPLLVDAGSAIAARDDAGAARDSGSPVPASEPDATVQSKDAGEAKEEEEQEEELDAGLGDAGKKKDAGSKDAGSKDAGSKDAGSKDAGSKDAGSKDSSTAIVDSSTPIEDGSVSIEDGSSPIVDSGSQLPDSSATPSDAGSMPADGGGPGAPDGGYQRSAACQACLDINCSNYLGVVPTLSDCSDPLCNQIVACAEQSKCVQGPLSVTNCYCGNVDFDACTVASYVPNGVCKTLIEQGLQSTAKDTVLERYLDNVNYVGGKANYLLTCEADLCVPECLMK